MAGLRFVANRTATITPNREWVRCAYVPSRRTEDTLGWLAM